MVSIVVRGFPKNIVPVVTFGAPGENVQTIAVYGKYNAKTIVNTVDASAAANALGRNAILRSIPRSMRPFTCRSAAASAPS